MAEDLVEVRCPRCGHTWQVDITELEKPGPAVYKGALVVQEYRVQCPKDGTWVVFTVEKAQSDDEAS